jgi:hypothetical protein
MSIRKNKKQVETLAWITDDEAEFWTVNFHLNPNNILFISFKVEYYTDKKSQTSNIDFKFITIKKIFIRD